MWSYISASTLKREAASVIMFWLLAAATYIMLTADTFEQRFQVLSIFALPIMGIFTAAFGADFIAKQTNIGGPPNSDGAPPTDSSGGK